MNAKILKRALKARDLLPPMDKGGGPYCGHASKYKQEAPNYTNHFIFIFKEQEPILRFNQVCSMKLNHDCDNTVEAVTHHVGNVDYYVGHELALTFYEWFLNYSPYAEVCVTKDYHDVVENRGLVLDPNAPAQLFGGAAIATRALTEQYDIGLTWNDLVQAGIHPNLAFMYAHNSSGGFGHNLLRKRILHGWHVAIHGDIAKSLNFIWNRPTYNISGSYKMNKRYGSPNSVWGLDQGCFDEIPEPLNRATYIMGEYKQKLKQLIPILKEVEIK